MKKFLLLFLYIPLFTVAQTTTKERYSQVGSTIFLRTDTPIFTGLKRLLTVEQINELRKNHYLEIKTDIALAAEYPKGILYLRNVTQVTTLFVEANGTVVEAKKPQQFQSFSGNVTFYAFGVLVLFFSLAWMLMRILRLKGTSNVPPPAVAAIFVIVCIGAFYLLYRYAMFASQFLTLVSVGILLSIFLVCVFFTEVFLKKKILRKKIEKMNVLH